MLQNRGVESTQCCLQWNDVCWSRGADWQGTGWRVVASATQPAARSIQQQHLPQIRIMSIMHGSDLPSGSMALSDVSSKKVSETIYRLADLI